MLELVLLANPGGRKRKRARRNPHPKRSRGLTLRKRRRVGRWMARWHPRAHTQYAMRRPLRRSNPFYTLKAIKEANAAAGHHFFEPATLRFFRSRVAPGVIGGRFFVTSEQFVGSDGRRAPRQYTVRIAHDNGSIQTVDKFQAFSSLAKARRAARSLADSTRPNPRRRSRGRRK